MGLDAVVVGEIVIWSMDVKNYCSLPSDISYGLSFCPRF